MEIALLYITATLSLLIAAGAVGELLSLFIW
jgi:hypothetical protein